MGVYAHSQAAWFPGRHNSSVDLFVASAHPRDRGLRPIARAREDLMHQAATPAAFLLIPFLDLQHDLYGRCVLADTTARALYASLAVWTWHAGERGYPFDLEDWARVLHVSRDQIAEAWRLCAPLFDVREGVIRSPQNDARRRTERAFQSTQASRGRRRWIKRTG